MGRYVHRIAISLCLLIAFTAASWAADWTIERATGTVWLVAPDASAEIARDGQVVPSGWTVATAPEGRALLRRGDESILLEPDSIIGLWDRGPITHIFQVQGEISLNVEHRALRLFRVQTPVLAAVVKGTEFTVTVADEMAHVGVQDGTVSVRSWFSLQRAMVEAGQGAGGVAGQRHLILDDEQADAGVDPLTDDPTQLGDDAAAAALLTNPATPPVLDAGEVARTLDPDDCKNGGWQELGFRNQGQCVSSANAAG